MTDDIDLRHAPSNAVKDKIFEEENKKMLDRLIERRFPDEVLAGKAFIYVTKELEVDDWGRVREFEGRNGSSFKTYLAYIIGRLLSDFSRAEFGYKRAPKWIEAMGSLWKRVYQLLCIEHWLPEEVMDRMQNPSHDKDREALVAEAIELILEKSPDCGKRKIEMISTDPVDFDSEAPQNPSFHDLSPEEALSERQQVFIRQTIYHCLTTPEEDLRLSPDQKRLRSKLLELRSELKLTPFEQEFLSLYSEEGYTVSSAGKMLGLRVDQASGRFRRLMVRIDEAMGKVSVKKEFRDLLH